MASPEPPPPTLRLAVLGDFGGPVKSPPAPLDRERFDEVLSGVSPSLHLEVPNWPSPGGRALALELNFQSLKDFSPVGVARQVPALRGLLETRELLERCDRGEVSAESVREGASSLVPAELIDALCSQLSESGSPPPSSSRRLAIAAPGEPRHAEPK